MRDFSQALGVPMPQIIKMLMDLGQMKTATQSLSDDEVELIAAELEREVTIKHADDEDVEPESYDDAEESLEARPPVVTIMGHVDHGKTTLLDAIRETAVVETEAGGITQHIGAYQTEIDGRKITFLDTPGHEAFTAMRARGAKVTDIAVLVVAADDGVMPQTQESISHARAAEVPIVVAVNKIDLPGANPDRVLAELATEGLQPEEWGGTTQVARVSAKQGEGLDDLLEQILLVADPELELKANPSAEASGPIIESRLDVGRGPVATMLVQRGTLKVGDAIVAGDAWGRVRALYDYRGEQLEAARARATRSRSSASTSRRRPASSARVVENDRRARDLAQQRGERLRREQLAKQASRGVSLEKLFEQLQAGGVAGPQHRPQGRRAGLGRGDRRRAAKIEHPEVRVNVIHTGVGGITENDVNLAAASNAMVIGFNVRPSTEARAAGRAAGHRDPPVPRHLRAHAADRAGARRHALAGRDRGRDRRGRGARAVPRLAARHDRRLHGHERRRAPQRAASASSATARASTRRRSRSSSASRTTPARSPRASSAASCSRASTTCARATSSRSTRRARSSGRRSTSRAEAAAGGHASTSLPRTPCSGYVAILGRRAALPRGRLAEGQAQVRASRRRRSSQNRFGASVAEVDHHELWQRCALTAAFVAREAREAEELAAQAEQWLAGQEWELVSLRVRLVSPDD